MRKPSWSIGVTYTSNSLEIDSYVFSGIYTIADYNENEVTIGPEGSLVLCQGSSLMLSVGMPYTTNIQWYRDGNLLSGQSGTSITVTGPGEYYVSAAPQVCPASVQTSLPTLVTINQDCNLNIGSHQKLTMRFAPNPVVNTLSFTASEQVDTIDIYNLAGQKVLSAAVSSLSGQLDVSSLASGVYIVETKAKGTSHKARVVKR
ncbi:MAG: T9SS type A sorting domain-containing protein [Proteobacteria bacterium]|nr:MAG: T9SS type A sorting domain-containing protein [Pseudomonadota bacterium]